MVYVGVISDSVMPPVPPGPVGPPNSIMCYDFKFVKDVNLNSKIVLIIQIIVMGLLLFLSITLCILNVTLCCHIDISYALVGILSD